MKRNTQHVFQQKHHQSIFRPCYYSIFFLFLKSFQPPSQLIRKYLTELEAWWRARVATLRFESARVRKRLKSPSIHKPFVITIKYQMGKNKFTQREFESISRIRFQA